MGDKEEKVSEEKFPSPSRTTALVKWTPSFAVGVSHTVYSGVTQVGSGLRKAFSRGEPAVEKRDSNQAASETDTVDEFLYEFVENWEGEDPPSPLLFDPDGDFIFLPRPTEEVPTDDPTAPGTSLPGQPPYVYIHSALWNTLKSVPAYPHNIQNYLKEHLHFPSKSLKKSLSEADIASSSDRELNIATDVNAVDSPSRGKSNDRRVRGRQDIKEDQTVQKNQEKEAIHLGGDLPLVDVHTDSIEGQVLQPQKSPRPFTLSSIRSPLAFRRKLPLVDRDSESGRETQLTPAEPNESDRQTCNQSECSEEEKVVAKITEDPPVLEIAVTPPEGQILIPKPVEKHLSWAPIRSRFSFRQRPESSSDHEAVATEGSGIDDKKENLTFQSGELKSVCGERQEEPNPATISEREEIIIPPLAQRHLYWIPVRTPFSFSKSAESEYSVKSSKVASTHEASVKEEFIPSHPAKGEVVSDTLNSEENQAEQLPVTITEGAASEPPLPQRHYWSWIPTRSSFRLSRPPPSDPDAEISRETPTGKVDLEEKPSDPSGETEVPLIPGDFSEGEKFASPSSGRPLSWITGRSHLKFSGPPTSDTNAEVTKLEPASGINLETKPTDATREREVVQIPADLSEGEILVPELAQKHFRWVPARFPFAYREAVKSEPNTGGQGKDSIATDVIEEPFLSEEPSSPIFQPSTDTTDPILESDTSSQSYWRPFPVRWLDPTTYRLLVANTIIRRREDLGVLLENSHLQASIPPDVDFDFDELKKIFSTFKALKNIQTPRTGTWSFFPVVPTIYRRHWKVPSESNSEGKGGFSRRRSSSVGCNPKESVEPFSPSDGSDNSKHTNFGNIHDSFKQFTVLEDSSGVPPGAEMASVKEEGRSFTGGGFFRSLRNRMWAKENGLPEARDGNASVSASGTEERINIAPSQESQQRASQLYVPEQDKNRLTKEWTNAREDLENFVATETLSLSGGLDLKKPEEQSSWLKDSFSSYFISPFLSKKCYICKEAISRKAQDDQCRRCKHVFCKKCVISNLQGGECMACRQDNTRQKENIPTCGPSRNHTESFKKFRQDFNTHGWDIERHQEELSFHPTIASVLRQCRRLTHGYKKCLEGKIDPNKIPGGGLLKRGIPDWQKPPTWTEGGTKEVRGCQLCSREWFVDPLHNCRLCGRRVCSQDSSRDFMLYIPDQETVEYSPKMNACWKIIRVVGCPIVEPEVKLYIRICFTCQDMLKSHQEKEFTLSYITLSPDYRKCEQTILEIHKETQRMKENIQGQLPQFVKIVDTFSTDSKNAPESVMKSLVKHQDDLMDQFPRYIIAVDKLREMSPQTEQQIKLLRSLMQEKRTFYRENVIVYRVAGRQLKEIMPKEEIEQRMMTVNADAINCACIVISQLAYEVLNICLKSGISDALAMYIKEVSEVCEKDLQKMIEQKRKTDKDETWENHKGKLHEFIKAEMKSERRYLKVDISKQTSDDLKNFLKRESYRRIRSTLIQLNAKSASRAFIDTKDALEKLQKATQNENFVA